MFSHFYKDQPKGRKNKITESRKFTCREDLDIFIFCLSDNTFH